MFRMANTSPACISPISYLQEHGRCLSYPLGLETWAHTRPRPTLSLQSYIHLLPASQASGVSFPLLHWSMMPLHDLVHKSTLTKTMLDYSFDSFSVFVRLLLLKTSYILFISHRAYSQNRTCDLSTIFCLYFQIFFLRITSRSNEQKQNQTEV